MSFTITSRIDRISAPVLPCARSESIIDLDIMKKESVSQSVNSECLYKGASHSPWCYPRRMEEKKGTTANVPLPVYSLVNQVYAF